MLDRRQVSRAFGWLRLDRRPVVAAGHLPDGEKQMLRPICRVEPRMVERHGVVIFLHNMKTGSETVRALVRQHYKSGTIYTADGKIHNAAELDGVKAFKAPQCRVIQGHIPFGVHELVAAPCHYITFLRRPEERILSLYYYSIQRSGAGFYRLAGPHRESIARFVRDAGILEVDNGQTRRISGMSPEFGRCTAETLERAKHNLASYFPVVGITERFDESVVLLQRFLGWPSAFYERLNATPDKPARAPISATDLEVIEQYNELDRELYSYAIELFERCVEQQGPAFPAEVHAFSALNRDVQPIWSHVRRVESQVRKLDGELAARRKQLKAARQQLAVEQAQGRQLESSRVWRLATRYRQVRARLGF